ncbi:MAG TPA: thiol:disulfide interchange protein DsbA/DsbL [Burkholderiales bacterium]|nr:thiol:disulfide interchange protein DsbA/DsbL [Burkholderiales bacterium]
MDKHRRILVAAVAAAALPVPLALRAQAASYATLANALQVENPAKVEVAEFFWYGCIHCYHLEPLLEAWVPKLPPDVYFRRIPAVFNEPRWAQDAAIFYAFEALGVLSRLHRPLFDAIHKDRLRTDNPAALEEWLVKNNVDPKKFDAALKSFGVQSKVKRARQLTAGGRIDGTPTLMVQGRYTISAEQGAAAMLTTAEGLFPVVRKTLAAAK